MLEDHAEMCPKQPASVSTRCLCMPRVLGVFPQSGHRQCVCSSKPVPFADEGLNHLSREMGFPGEEG